MAVYQPSAIIGNSRLLVTLGAHGELMSLFWPNVDYSQNLYEGMPALYVGAPGTGRLCWVFDAEWSGEQAYVEDTNVVVTRLRHRPAGVEVVFTDFVSPERDVLVRRLEVANRSARKLRGSLFQYLHFRLGETAGKNSARWVAQPGAIVQYWRHIWLAVGGDFAGHQCGRATAPHNSAKADLEDGALQGNPEEIGDANLAVQWPLSLARNQSVRGLLLIAADRSEGYALDSLRWANDRGADYLQTAADRHWHEHEARSRLPRVPEDWLGGYRRCLLTLPLLQDAHYGGILAAPEFDPQFEASGGYGYCWPRDAAEAAIALERAGQTRLSDAFFTWAREAQSPGGYWEQRYWMSGQRGPAWCTHDDRLQIDQTAAVAHALWDCWRRREAAGRSALIADNWVCMRAACEHLAEAVDDRGRHRIAFGPWETFQGVFTYSSAAIAAALRGGAEMAAEAGEGDAAARWRAAADRIKTFCLETLWLGGERDGYFARRMAEDGRLDTTVDSSILGVVEPFDLLDLADPREREMAERSVATVCRRLGVRLEAGPAIIRFEGDSYLGGAVGGVNTLWLARVLLRLALAYQGREAEKSNRYRTQAVRYLRTVTARTTPAGLLPELIGRPGQPAYWAAPHAWAMAAYMACLFLLERLEGADGPSPAPAKEMDRGRDPALRWE
jgi:oligosaccharide amylase